MHSPITRPSRLRTASSLRRRGVGSATSVFVMPLLLRARIRLVAPDYLNTLGIRIREGRDIAITDSETAQPVVVINQTLARRLAPTGTVVGRAVIVLDLQIPVLQEALCDDQVVRLVAPGDRRGHLPRRDGIDRARQNAGGHSRLREAQRPPPR